MPLIDVERRDRVAVLTLDDRRRRNAMSLAMAAEIGSALDELEVDDSVGAVVVTGRPPAFCSGADLGSLGGSDREAILGIYEGFLRIARSPLPSIAAVNGAAVGAGMNLVLVCDLCLAAPDARFDSRFLQLGIHPGGGHTWMLPRVAGRQTLSAMVLFGEVLDGEQAVARGLAWRCVAPDQLLDAACELAGRAARVRAELREATKRTLRDMPSIAAHGAAVERELGPQVESLVGLRQGHTD
jgi:enoyl-CoA hydratase